MIYLGHIATDIIESVASTPKRCRRTLLVSLVERLGKPITEIQCRIGLESEIDQHTGRVVAALLYAVMGIEDLVKGGIDGCETVGASRHATVA